MSIVFDENLDLFCLETANTSYIIGLADHRTFVGHVYYGRRDSQTGSALSAPHRRGTVCSVWE